MIDFSTLATLKIPEGEVARIDVNGVKKWEIDILGLYQRVESITTTTDNESGERGWFLTDFVPNDKSGMEFTYAVTTFVDRTTMGATTGGTDEGLYVFYPRTAAIGYARWGKLITKSGLSMATYTKYRTQINWGNDRYVRLFDENNANVFSPTKFTGKAADKTYPCVAICRYNNKNNNPSSSRGLVVYSARLQQTYDDGSHVVERDYVPCYRKSDGEIGLFDLVTKTFLPSQVKGGFTKGEDIDWNI